MNNQSKQMSTIPIYEPPQQTIEIGWGIGSCKWREGPGNNKTSRLTSKTGHPKARQHGMAALKPDNGTEFTEKHWFLQDNPRGEP